MTRIIVLFGTFAGLVAIGAMIAVIVPWGGQPAVSDHSVWLGYLILIVALSMIFFGVKRYRDRDLGGVIKFLPAFLVGLGIAAVAGIIYVAVWEVYLASTNYTFAEAYANSYISSQKAAGLGGAKLDALIAEMNSFKEQYANPLIRLPMTFLEIFPVGLIVALISAALLRNSKVLPDRT